MILVDEVVIMIMSTDITWGISSILQWDAQVGLACFRTIDISNKIVLKLLKIRKFYHSFRLFVFSSPNVYL